MPLDMTAVLFSVAVATLAEGLLGEAPGRPCAGCDQNVPHGHAGVDQLAPCTDPADGCPPAARTLASEAR